MVIEIWSSRYDDSWGEGNVTVIGIVVALRPSLLLRQDNGVISCTISDMKDLFFALMTTTHFTWFIIIFKWLNMKENSFNEFIWYPLETCSQCSYLFLSHTRLGSFPPPIASVPPLRLFSTLWALLTSFLPISSLSMATDRYTEIGLPF